MATDDGKGPQQADADVRAGMPARHREIATAEQAVGQAQARVAATRRWLHEIRLEMLLGSGDTEQYDEALLGCRAAETALRAAQAACDGLPDRAIVQGVAADGQHQSAGAGAEPTPEMRFARWLVEHGRLSEWNVREPEPEARYAPSA